jgi:chemotaxis protein histidine kinase CheA
VDHGLEKKEERVAKDKPEVGMIRAFLDADGRLCIGDDGRGLSITRIEAKARQQGLVAKTPEETANLIFESGFSTKDSANEISGRGIGMDAVRDFMRSVGSNIEIVAEGSLEHGFLKFHFAIDLPRVLLRKTA